MERCPICRSRLNGKWLCPRCGSDLSLPLKIEQRAQLFEQNAVIRIAAGEMEQAERVLDEAMSLKSTLLLRVLQMFVRANQ